MKTKLRFGIIILLAMTTFTLPAQDIQKFLGEYRITVTCSQETPDGVTPEPPVVFQLIVIPDEENQSGVQLVFLKPGISGIYAPVKATILDEQNFDISDQLPGPLFATMIDGNGNIKGDSIFIQYVTEMWTSVFRCDCEGKRSSSDVAVLKADKYNVYVDAAKQIILDEALQNQETLIVELIDLQGVTILKKMNNGEPVSIANFPSGVYLLRISQDSRVVYSGKIFR